MPFPETSRLELPILQELKATGGSDQVRYLYDRLAAYFPQLTPDDMEARNEAGRSRWRVRVQLAGRELESLGELKREKQRWTITQRGLRRVEVEAVEFAPTPASEPITPRTLTHKEAQSMLVEIGQMLGHHAVAEFERFDVVWRDTPTAPRLSHVFEVQIAGSVDSALVRLKQAYEAQRSRIFLVIADTRDTEFARKRLVAALPEIGQAVEIIGVGQLQRLYESLQSQAEILEKLL